MWHASRPGPAPTALFLLRTRRSFSVPHTASILVGDGLIGRGRASLWKRRVQRVGAPALLTQEPNSCIHPEYRTKLTCLFTRNLKAGIL
jgi:hypothetical protein